MQGLNISKLVPWKSLVFLIVGLVGLGVLIARQGSSLIGDQLLAVGPVFLAVLGISFFCLFLQTFAWQVCLGESKASFWSLFKIKTGGEALDRLLPFSLVGGSAVQGNLLRDKHQIEAGAESIVLDRSIQNVALALFVWVALMVGFLNAALLPMTLRLGIPILVLLAGGIFVWTVWSRGPGLASPLLRLISEVGIAGRASPSCRGTLSESDRVLLKFYQDKRGAFYQGLFLQLLCQGLLVAEVYLIGKALLPGFTPALALVLAAIAPLVSIVFCFIPGAFGIMELIFAALLGLAFGPSGGVVGISLVLIRRARALFWIVVGLVMTGNPFKMFLKAA